MTARQSALVVFATLLLLTGPALALNLGTDLYVPAAARAGSWVTDLYIFNPGTNSANVSIAWLPRDTDNSGVTGQNFTVAAGQTLVLADVIKNIFGLDNAAGAFHLTSDTEVVANCRIYTSDGSNTFGQGFEGVPAGAAIADGRSTDIVGLAQNGRFRSNFFAVNTGSSPATITFTLYDAAGSPLASRAYTLKPYAAFYRNVTDLGEPSFDAGILHAAVSGGTAIVVGSKIDNASGDPGTLEAWWTMGSGGGGGSCGGDGIYVGYIDYTWPGGLMVMVGGNAITYLQGAVTLISDFDGGINCVNVFELSTSESDGPFAIDSDGSFTASFEVEYDSGWVLAFTFTGQLQEDTLLGDVDLNVSGGDPYACSGDMNTVAFYAGHTILTLSK